jgi:hypothetical protein
MKSPLLLLRREEVVLPAPAQSADTIDATADTTIAFAERELGYVPPVEKARRARTEALKKASERPLGQALVSAGIKPFAPDSVRKYKTRMAQSFILCAKPAPDWLQGFAVVLTVIAFSVAGGYLFGTMGAWTPIVSLVVLCSFVFTRDRYKATAWWKQWNTAINYGLALPLIVLSGMFAMVLLVELTGPPKKIWRQVPLKGYEGDVPRFALETAQEIKMRCPDVEFFVEELVRNEARHDPFLVAKRGEEKVHVEVWAEPGFDQKRIV